MSFDILHSFENINVMNIVNELLDNIERGLEDLQAVNQYEIEHIRYIQSQLQELHTIGFTLLYHSNSMNTEMEFELLDNKSCERDYRFSVYSEDY